jgi:outer membrane immunogenic protein
VKILAGSAVLTALVFSLSNANAADMAAKARPIIAPPPPTWTGFYFGGHIGGGWSDWNSSTLPLPSEAAFGDFGTSFGDSNGSGVLGGLQLGYNWQVAPNWVLGLEGDISWTDVSSSQTAPILAFPGGAPVAGASQFMSRDVNWLASIRGRIGYAWDRALLYFTGGFAWGDVDYAGNYAFPGIQYPTSFSNTETGYVLGGGLEYMFTPNWTIRGEYLYYNLGSASSIGLPIPANPPFAVGYNWNDTQVHVGRFAINYKF